MKKIITITYIIPIILFSQINDDLNKSFQIGLYGIQPQPGSKGHQTGKLTEIKEDINEVKGTINAAIPYRHWDRVDHSNWRYTEYLTNYMHDMFLFTCSDSLTNLIQVFTPPLYSSFVNPPLKKSPEDDSGIDRSIDINIFSTFIKNMLNYEIQLVWDFVNKDSAKFTEIMLNKQLRPLGGWYLDDEPLIRNHDVEVIESMSKIINLIETSIFYNNKILQKHYDKLENYHQLKYIAFDADDLHNYAYSSRKSDALVYNRDGKILPLLKTKKYTLFEENTFDVIMLDFYHNDETFWDKIFREVKDEFIVNNLTQPLFVPIFQGFQRNSESTPINYKTLLQKMDGYEILGVWFYVWQDTSDKTKDFKELWFDQRNNIKNEINNLKNLKLQE